MSHDTACLFRALYKSELPCLCSMLRCQACGLGSCPVSCWPDSGPVSASFSVPLLDVLDVGFALGTSNTSLTPKALQQSLPTPACQLGLCLEVCPEVCRYCHADAHLETLAIRSDVAPCRASPASRKSSRIVVLDVGFFPRTSSTRLAPNIPWPATNIQASWCRQRIEGRVTPRTVRLPARRTGMQRYMCKVFELNGLLHSTLGPVPCVASASTALWSDYFPTCSPSSSGLVFCCGCLHFRFFLSVLRACPWLACDACHVTDRPLIALSQCQRPAILFFCASVLPWEARVLTRRSWGIGFVPWLPASLGSSGIRLIDCANGRFYAQLTYFVSCFTPRFGQPCSRWRSSVFMFPSNNSSSPEPDLLVGGAIFADDEGCGSLLAQIPKPPHASWGQTLLDWWNDVWDSFSRSFLLLQLLAYLRLVVIASPLRKGESTLNRAKQRSRNLLRGAPLIVVAALCLPVCSAAPAEPGALPDPRPPLSACASSANAAVHCPGRAAAAGCEDDVQQAASPRSRVAPTESASDGESSHEASRLTPWSYALQTLHFQRASRVVAIGFSECRDAEDMVDLAYDKFDVAQEGLRFQEVTPQPRADFAVLLAFHSVARFLSVSSYICPATLPDTGWTTCQPEPAWMTLRPQ